MALCNPHRHENPRGSVQGLADGPRGRPHAFAVHDGLGSGLRVRAAHGHTTHADHAVHDIPCTSLSDGEGGLGRRRGQDLRLDPAEMTMILVVEHGPFSWGRSAGEAIRNAPVLEEIGKMSLYSRLVNPDRGRFPHTSSKNTGRENTASRLTTARRRHAPSSRPRS